MYSPFAHTILRMWQPCPQTDPLTNGRDNSDSLHVQHGSHQRFSSERTEPLERAFQTPELLLNLAGECLVKARTVIVIAQSL